MIIEYDTTPTPAVVDLSATSSVGQVELAWTNPIAYDSIEIHRVLVSFGPDPPLLLATLPGTATQYVAATSQSAAHGFCVIGKVSGSPSLLARIDSETPYTGAHLYIPPVLTFDNALAETSVMLDNTAILMGWSFGVCHDPSSLALDSVAIGATTATVNGGNPPFFRHIGRFAGGFTVGVVIHSIGAISLPPGNARELEVATWEVVAAAPATTSLQFCETLGSPPVAVVVVVSGVHYQPLTTDGSVTILEREFIRADANGDLSVDVADPIFLGAHLFGGGDDPPCRAACDANGDLLVDVADMVFTLGHLFSQGPAPGDHFPACGPEPVPSLECAEPAVCP